VPALLFIYLLPLGDGIPKDDVAAVQRALAIYSAPVQTLAPVPLPKAAWYAPRARYRAEKLLDFLRERVPANASSQPAQATMIIGLTASDISTTKDAIDDWGVLGLGDLDGKASVISTFRCKMKAKSAAHVRERLAKVAVHEVGHTLGLDHCPTPGCLMNDALGKVASVDRERDLCARCRSLLEKRGLAVEKTPFGE
jgi:archaemetzincin